MDQTLVILVASSVLSFGLGAVASWLRARAKHKLADAVAAVNAAHATPQSDDDKEAEAAFASIKESAQRTFDIADAIETTDPGRLLANITKVKQ